MKVETIVILMVKVIALIIVMFILFSVGTSLAGFQSETSQMTWEAGLFVALLFSLLMNDGPIIPNPLMPPFVRLSHFIETASSNFIWGWAIVGLLLWRPRHA